MIFGAILAGGVGSRMNIADMPKQFLMLGSKPIIIHTIEKFLMCARFDKIYIGVHPDWFLHMSDLIKKYNLDAEKLVCVTGGKDRNSTIFNIIRHIKESYGNNDDDIIVTHDSVRPFVTSRIIEENIDAALNFGACDTVINATDTIVISKNDNTITNIPNRKFMYQGQTPQSFKINLIFDLYNDLNDEEKATLTDACKICVVRNCPVHLVAGEVSNMKITTVTDYKIAIAMVGGIKVD
ncbi:MAG: 2-C-methyl-D-erythritol 4-phosphate cytidylyltransferase [Acutalibacteraceae bacterium]